MSHELFTELAEIVRAPFFDGGHVETPAKGSGNPLDLARFLGAGHVAEITTKITPDLADGVTYLSIFADDVEIAKIDIFQPEIDWCAGCSGSMFEEEPCSPVCEPSPIEGYTLEMSFPSYGAGASWFESKRG